MYVYVSRCRHQEERHNSHGSSNATRVITSRRGAVRYPQGTQRHSTGISIGNLEWKQLLVPTVNRPVCGIKSVFKEQLSGCAVN